MNFPENQYNPTSKILFLSICSLHKKKGGTRDYQNDNSIIRRLSPEKSQLLLKTRDNVRNLIWSGSISWAGVPTPDLEYNNNLAPGPDFGGNAEWAEYLPAIYRYSGRFLLALGEDGKKKLVESPHHSLFISGLYGLVTPLEPIQLYSCPLEGESEVQKIWKDDKILSKILADYIKKNEITLIFDFTAREDYRKVVDWNFLKRNTGVQILHCFTKMSAYDYALQEFGILLKENFLNYSEKDLLAVKTETVINDVIFREIPETIAGLPKENEIFIIKKAAREIPNLNSYSIEQLPSKLGIPGSIYCYDSIELHEQDFDELLKPSIPVEKREYFLAFTSEFQRNLFQYNDKKLQGRILEAIADIIKSPDKTRGDTIKPLKGELQGKWRYRIGDFRLIYQTDNLKKTIYLIAIRPRGDAYD